MAFLQALVGYYVEKVELAIPMVLLTCSKAMLPFFKVTFEQVF